MRRIIDLLLPQGIRPACAECHKARTPAERCMACAERTEAIAAYLRLRVRRLHASSTRWGQLAEDVRSRSRLSASTLQAAIAAQRVDASLDQFDQSRSQGHANVHPTSPLTRVPLDSSFF